MTMTADANPKHNLQAQVQRCRTTEKIEKYEHGASLEVLKNLVTKRTQDLLRCRRSGNSRMSTWLMPEAGEVITAEEAERRVLVEVENFGAARPEPHHQFPAVRRHPAHLVRRGRRRISMSPRRSVSCWRARAPTRRSRARSRNMPYGDFIP